MCNKSEKYPFKLQVRFSVYNNLCAEYLTSLPYAMPLPCRHPQLEVEPGFKLKPSELWIQCSFQSPSWVLFLKSIWSSGDFSILP